MVLVELVVAGAAEGRTSSKMQADSDDKNRIAVISSEQRPFVKISQNKDPTGLDALIITNFVQHFNLSVDYFIINDSLNFILSHEQFYNTVSVQANLR